jgi:hypothetical protein
MWEWKSKRNGRISVLTNEEHAEMMRKGIFLPKNFIITELQIRTIVPLRTEEKAIKQKIKKKE